MADYISREVAIERFCNVYCGCSPEECGFKIPQDGAEECAVVRALKETPAADVRRVVRAEWIDYNPADHDDPRMKCSNCGVVAMPLVDDVFCPRCGADMREVKADG